MTAFALLFTYAGLIDASIDYSNNPSVWVKNMYGDKIEFIINRNDKTVGKHVIEFGQTKDHFEVRSSTKIDVKFLFFTAYKFRLQTNEYWSGGDLKKVDSKTNDGGKKTTLTKTFKGNQYLLPTSHWNPSVLKEDEVYNTITGKTNSIEISPIGWDKVSTGEGVRDALRYDYHGDLTDVSAWYDDLGRWVSLRFKARDGSTISYMCVQCGK